MDSHNKKGRSRKQTSRKARQNKPRKSDRSLPRTASVHSRKSSLRMKASRANTAMTLSELQFMAKSRGIPFGGLSRAKLVRKINNYMY